MTQKRTIIILITLIILCTAVIFSFSLKSREESSKDSNFIVNIIKPIIENVFGNVSEDLGLIVRKLAHMTEFCILSILVAMLSIKIYEYKSKAIFGSALFYVLAVAVSDEFIQYFSGRGSSVVDVVIDFSGASIGFLTVYSVRYFIPAIRSKLKSPESRQKSN